MDKELLHTKRLDIYFSTLQIGFGLLYVPEHKTLHLHLGAFEFAIYIGEIPKWN